MLEFKNVFVSVKTNFTLFGEHDFSFVYFHFPNLKDKKKKVYIWSLGGVMEEDVVLIFMQDTQTHIICRTLIIN